MTENNKCATGNDGLPVWNLDDLYSGEDAPELTENFAALEQSCQAFTYAYQDKIRNLDADGLLDCILAYENIETGSGRISSFADLRFAQNTADPSRGKFLNDCRERLTAMAVQLTFFEIEINSIEDAELQSLLADQPGLARFEQLLERIRKLRPHQLSLELEQYINDTSVTGAAAWHRLFDETISAKRFLVGGEALTLEQSLDRMSDPDRARREEAAKAIAAGMQRDLPLFSLITNTLAKAKSIEDAWRQFNSPQAARHLSNDVEPETVNALRDAVVAAYPRISHRYYRMKAKWLGLDQLEIWDRVAPLPETQDRRIGWDEARSIVLSSYEGFSTRMAEIAAEFFEKGWIDAAIMPGKSPGAFSHPTVTSVHPYILMNYLGKPRDVMVLAHELGHGVHQTLAASQGELLSRTSLTMAETASVFGEMLVFKRLLNEARDERERQSLIARKVEDMINTMVRQVAFYDFESRLHANRAEGELTPSEINRHWLDVQSESLGPAFRFMEGYETYWSYVPHFIHVPFYVYAYAFGQGLTHALFALYEESTAGFEDKYFDLLGAGGSRHYRELLAPFGIDPSDSGFWKKGLGVIERMIDDLEAMET